MQKAGAFLKNMRQEKSFTVDDVSKNTKISPSVIRALEDGRLDGIDQVYLKGFLKLYCRFLGIDWEQFLKEYPLTPTTGKHAYKTAQLKKSEEGSPTRSTTAINFISENKKIILLLLYAVVAVLSFILLFRGCHKPTTTAGILKQEKVKPQGTKKLQNISTQAIVPKQKEMGSRAIKLGILVKEDSFLKVMVDGRLVYHNVLRKGKQETWLAKDKIELSVGNAGGIELEVDGKKYTPLGRRGQAIKNIVIDRQGLKISQ